MTRGQPRPADGFYTDGSRQYREVRLESNPSLEPNSDALKTLRSNRIKSNLIGRGLSRNVKVALFVVDPISTVGYFEPAFPFLQDLNQFRFANILLFE